MANFEFSLDHTLPEPGAAVGIFEAVVPQADSKGNLTTSFPSYIRINKGKEFALFKVTRPGKYRNSIFINEAVLPGKDNDDIIAYSEVSERRFLWYRFINDKSLILAKWGLGIAIAGTFIDGSFAIGKIKPLVLITLTDWQEGFLTGVAMILKIVGLILVFWNSVKEAK